MFQVGKIVRKKYLGLENFGWLQDLAKGFAVAD